MASVLYRIFQWTWGLPQSLIGAVVSLAYIRCPHFSYKGSRVVLWPRKTSASLGMFVFVSNAALGGRRARSGDELDSLSHRLLVHEYGHTIQSLILGPLYLPVMALPSSAWCNIAAFERYRRRTKRSYYSFYTEKSADWLGEHVTGEQSMGSGGAF